MLLHEPSVQTRGEECTTVDMFNPDGSNMGMCGNGIRCVFGYYKKYIDNSVSSRNFLVEGKIIHTAEVQSPDTHSPMMVQVDMDRATNLKSLIVKIAGGEFFGTSVLIPNPHFIIEVEELPSRELLTLHGSQLELAHEFPNRTNVEFVKIISRSEIDIAVWERGAGITLACGTGACASFFALCAAGKVDTSVKANLPGGTLFLELKTNGVVSMIGAAKEVFNGEYRWQ